MYIWHTQAATQHVCTYIACECVSCDVANGSTPVNDNVVECQGCLVLVFQANHEDTLYIHCINTQGVFAPDQVFHPGAFCCCLSALLGIPLTQNLRTGYSKSLSWGYIQPWRIEAARYGRTASSWLTFTHMHALQTSWLCTQGATHTNTQTHTHACVYYSHVCHLCGTYVCMCIVCLSFVHRCVVCLLTVC